MNDPIELPTYPDEDLASLTHFELTNLLIENEDRAPRNAIDECARRGDEMTAHLRQLHEEDYLWDIEEDDGRWWLLLHAMMILGKIPSEQAGLLLVELMHRTDMEEDENLQDWLSGYWVALFRNKPESVQPALRKLCEDGEVGWFMRANAFDPVIEAASRQGGETLEQALAWLAKIAEDEDENWECRMFAASLLLDFPRTQYRLLLENLETRQDGLGKHFNRQEIERSYAAQPDPPQWERFDNPWKFYEPEAIAERQQRWREEDAQENLRRAGGGENYQPAPSTQYYDDEPYIRPEPKIGRNDPCPCGSGKKYKKCCMKTEQAQPVDDLLWGRIRRLHEGLTTQLPDFARQHFGQDALLEAWDEFIPHWDDGQGEPFAPDTPHMQIFMPWFFYDWVPLPEETSVNRAALDGRTLGQVFLDKKGKRLDPLLVRYMEQCCIAPFSFFDVLSVRPGEGFVLRDIMTGEEMDVTEHSGSRHAQAGKILFAKVIKIDSIAMLEACAPVLFPPLAKGPILELRKEIESRELPLTAELLKDYCDEILDIYHDITDSLLNPAMPELQNTDGDPLLLHKLIYTLECTPREALDTLKILNLTEDDKSILTDAEFYPDGKLRKIGFAWEKPGNKKHKDWNNTILGHIKIEDSNLTAEINSENRAEKFKALVEELLPGKARYKTTVIQSPQSMLARAGEKGESAQTRQTQKEIEELNSRPEIQALLAEKMRQHYRDWPGMELPALNGLTPLQAVKTRDGKEMVAALLTDIEQRSQHATPPLDPAIIAELRERLGLLR